MTSQLCCLFRNLGVNNGIESLISGYPFSFGFTFTSSLTCQRFIGGCAAFGDSNGVSGSVNNQIVLYLFARSIQGVIQSAVNRGMLPSNASVSAIVSL